jgi:hypothetical protein
VDTARVLPITFIVFAIIRPFFSDAARLSNTAFMIPAHRSLDRSNPVSAPFTSRQRSAFCALSVYMLNGMPQ